jgi:hypothetical protein
MEVKNKKMYTKCGGISHEGTSNGKLRNVGKSTVNVGKVRMRLELRCWKNKAISFVFVMMIIDVINIIHSAVMFT